MAGLFDFPELPPRFPIRNLRPWLNQLRAAVMALRPGRSPDLISRVTAEGTTQKFARRIVGGGGTTTIAPFTIADASTTAGTPAAKVTVSFGAIQNVVPTMDGDSLALGHAHTFSSAGTYNGYIDTDGSAPIVTWSTSAVPADSSTHSYLLIGQVVVVTSGAGYAVSGDPLQAVSSSYLARYCSGSIWFWTALEVP